MSRILLSGGAGFVGSHILDLLLADGHDVLVVDNFSTGRRENIAHHAGNGHIQVSDDDIRDQSSMRFLFHDFRPEIVCHQAAQASLLRSHQEPVLDAEINILGTLRLMKLAEEYECKKFVFASTSAVFGGAPSYYLCREEDATLPASPYGISKCAAELYLKTSNVPTTIIRYGNVYGPRQVPVGENQLIARLLNHLYKKGDFKIYGDGSHRRDFVYVDDIARANFAAMFSDIVGVVHAGTGNSRSVIEIVRIVCEKTGYKLAFIEKGPEIAEPTVSALGTIRADWSALWSPLTTLEQGIQKTIDWWKAEV